MQRVFFKGFLFFLSCSLFMCWTRYLKRESHTYEIMPSRNLAHILSEYFRKIEGNFWSSPESAIWRGSRINSFLEGRNLCLWNNFHIPIILTFVGNPSETFSIICTYSSTCPVRTHADSFCCLFWKNSEGCLWDIFMSDTSKESKPCFLCWDFWVFPKRYELIFSMMCYERKSMIRYNSYSKRIRSIEYSVFSLKQEELS